MKKSVRKNITLNPAVSEYYEQWSITTGISQSSLMHMILKNHVMMNLKIGSKEREQFLKEYSKYENINLGF